MNTGHLDRSFYERWATRSKPTPSESDLAERVRRAALADRVEKLVAQARAKLGGDTEPPAPPVITPLREPKPRNDRHMSEKLKSRLREAARAARASERFRSMADVLTIDDAGVQCTTVSLLTGVDWT